MLVNKRISLSQPRWATTYACLLLAMGFLGCSAGGSEPDPMAGIPSATEFAEFAPATIELQKFEVLLQTSIAGETQAPMVFVLWPEIAPKTVRHFLRLCRSGFYDGLGFHRVVADVMVQGGCVNGDGSGGSPYGNVEAEFQRDPKFAHQAGVLSMARSTGPNSASAQFFIITQDGPKASSLNGQYTSFGRLVEGEHTLAALASVPVMHNTLQEESLPTSALLILSATIQPSRDRAAPEPIPDAHEDALSEWDVKGVVSIQCLQLAYAGGSLHAQRTEAEALALAQSIVAKAGAGADFQVLVSQYSDDPVQLGQEDPVGYHFTDHGVTSRAGEEQIHDTQEIMRQALIDIQMRKQSGEIDSLTALQLSEAQQFELMRIVRKRRAIPREERAPLSDVAFASQPGEVRIVDPEATRSLGGIFVVKRLP